MKKTLITLSLILLSSLHNAHAAELTVQIDGIESNAGSVVVRVYSGKENWLEDEGYVAVAELDLADWISGDVVNIIIDTAPGQYAISAYQDEDSDGELDSNFIGIPKEPAGMSNKPKARMGPPRYEDAAFDLPEEGLSIIIELND